MLKIEYSNTQDKYYFLYVTDLVRISSTHPNSFMVEDWDYRTEQIHNIWSYLNQNKGALFELSVLTQYSKDVINTLQVLKACGGSDED
ncbi:hypothetical protein OLZ33_22950 [Pantoea ananatis]|uniref:hypothetical protein n=1 Tax=Pantoea ananas TaxID=553 RepID=UPI00222280C4|nr:hypothetical protein [Pantoea ananatis]MCW1834817.1 hypothetical protein [Pantoea ananatis]